ncbi:MAG: hypothetical protein KatS3mg015_2669 [Fimbriimonadales bacterium]|nr:MAG: hypothetical protein KatS3mg015_2669 [Fimbriimonadales bacterium]
MLSLELPSSNTKLYRLTIGPHTFVFSYTTVVAYSGPLGNCRRRNEWGPTTGRHLRDYRHFPEVEEAEMHLRILGAIADTGLRITTDKLKGAAI